MCYRKWSKNEWMGPVHIVTLSENAGRINDEDDEVKLNTLTHVNKKTEHAFNGLHAYISVLTHFMYNTWNIVTHILKVISSLKGL